MMAVKERENRKSASHPTRSEAMAKDVLDLYSSISSLSLFVEPCEACPPEGMAFFLLMVDDSSARSLSISAFWDLIVSFSSERAEDDSCCLAILLLLRFFPVSTSCSLLEGDLLTNASCDVGSGL